MNSEKLPRILAEKWVAESRIFKVQALEIEYGNGTRVNFERLVASSYGAVLIVPILDDSLVLIREYSAGVKRYELGFPKGKIDAGETWAQAAVRESMEEIGFKPANVKILDSVTLSAGYMSHQTHIVLAQDLTPETALGDEPEPLEVIYWPIKDWSKLMEHPEFTEGRAFAALMLLLKELKYI